MRTAFINTLINLSETDPDLYLLTADMGFGLVEPFATRYPKQYINVGVAEQNMIGVATGLALEGKRVFCYSIGNFPTMRCLEQIRNDVCYHNLPVCIVSGGAGLWYGSLGMTHWAVEDIAVMRSLPNMAIITPYDTVSMTEKTHNIYANAKPCYLRMSRSSNNPLPDEEESSTQGKAKGYALILSVGGRMTEIAVRASRELTKNGIANYVVAIPQIKPFNDSALTKFVKQQPTTDIIITIEEHSRVGGLGSAVAEVLAGMREHPPLVRLGTGDKYPSVAMSYEELLKYHHLDVDGIVDTVLEVLK